MSIQLLFCRVLLPGFVQNSRQPPWVASSSRVSLDFHLVDNLHPLPMHMFKSLSADEILLPRYMNWSTISRAYHLMRWWHDWNKRLLRMDTHVLAEQQKLIFLCSVRKLNADKRTYQERWPTGTERERERERKRERERERSPYCRHALMIMIMIVTCFYFLLYSARKEGCSIVLPNLFFCSYKSD